MTLANNLMPEKPAMIDATRPRRSALYLPASNAKAMAKARTVDADVVILDLEDAVSPDSKILARDAAVAALGEGGYGRREIVIRVNGLDTPWGRDDLAAVAQSGADAILVPKVDDADECERGPRQRSAGVTVEGGDGQRPKELDRHRRAQREEVDGREEAQRHDARHHPQQDRGSQLAP